MRIGSPALGAMNENGQVVGRACFGRQSAGPVLYAAGEVIGATGDKLHDCFTALLRDGGRRRGRAFGRSLHFRHICCHPNSARFAVTDADPQADSGVRP
jgi:hypothetical protein